MISRLLSTAFDVISEGQNQKPVAVHNELDLNNGGWILIGILIALVAIFIITTIYFGYKASAYKSIAETKNNSTDISETEMNVIEKYRNLTDNDKAAINQMLNSLDNKLDKE